MTPYDDEKVYGAKPTGVILVLLGILTIGIGTGVTVIASDTLLAFLLMGMPTLFLGLIELLTGFATFAARIEMSRNDLTIAAPAWRACPLPPVRRFRLRWDEIRAVRQRAEIYHLLPGGGLPFPVDVYAVDTEKGRIVLGGKSLRGLAEAMREIAARSGGGMRAEEPVRAGLFRSFVQGPPAWP